MTHPLTLTQRFVPQQRVDCSPLTPTVLAGKSARKSQSLQLQSGNRKLPAGELFKLSGDDRRTSSSSAKAISLNASAHVWRRHVRVQGDCGAYVGLQMRGGEIHVSGSAGAFAACQMRGGLLRIEHDAENFSGAALPGENAAWPVAASSSKATLEIAAVTACGADKSLIEGHAADYCAARMLAGTIAVMGSVGAHLGFAMQRGTVLLRESPAHVLPTFGDCGTHESSFLKLLFQSWTALLSRYAAFAPQRTSSVSSATSPTVGWARF